MTVTTTPITAEELYGRGDIGRAEIIYGELITMSPAGAEHGQIVGVITAQLTNHVRPRQLGLVLAGDVGFLLARDPDLLRAPDVAFVRAERVARGLPRTYFPGAPDIAVEVVSPGDALREVGEKVAVWLAHGAASVWVADPATMTITLHRTGQTPRRFILGDTFRDEATLPGFTMEVGPVFRPLGGA
jgi:Uma2 family endonuclease